MTAVAEPPAMLTVEEAADLLRISRRSAYRLVERGEIPSVQWTLRTKRIPRRALEQELERRAAEAVRS